MSRVDESPSLIPSNKKGKRNLVIITTAHKKPKSISSFHIFMDCSKKLMYKKLLGLNVHHSLETGGRKEMVLSQLGKRTL